MGILERMLASLRIIRIKIVHVDSEAIPKEGEIFEKLSEAMLYAGFRTNYFMRYYIMIKGVGGGESAVDVYKFIHDRKRER